MAKPGGVGLLDGDLFCLPLGEGDPDFDLDLPLVAGGDPDRDLDLDLDFCLQLKMISVTWKPTRHSIFITKQRSLPPFTVSSFSEHNWWW